MMWWIPILTICLVAVAVIGLQGLQDRRQRRSVRVYRAKYLQLVAQLEGVTISINDLASDVPQVKDESLLDYYEGCLRLLETLLHAVKRMPPFGSDMASLNSALFLVRDCRERVERTEKAFQDALSGRGVKLDRLFGRSSSSPSSAGCYFCSRPMIPSRFSTVRVKIDAATKEVLSCAMCRDELQHSKKVKVLYFLKDGRPVHWAEVPSYRPTEDYWSINKRGFMRTTKLELVSTTAKDSDGSGSD